MKLIQEKVKVNPVKIEFSDDELSVVQHFVKNTPESIQAMFSDNIFEITRDDFDLFLDEIENCLSKSGKNEPIKPILIEISNAFSMKVQF